MKSSSDLDFFERLQRGIRKGVSIAFDAHFKAGRNAVVFHNGRIVERARGTAALAGDPAFEPTTG